MQVSGKPSSRATAAGLARIKLRKGFSLPPSYRRFAQTYGYGRLGGLLLVFIPKKGGDDLARRSRGLARMLVDSIDAGLFEYGPKGSERLVRRLIPFGISDNGHTLAWDPERVRGSEARIYVVGSKCLAVYEGGVDFDDFLARCFDRRVKKVLGPGYAPLPRTFVALR